MEIPRRDAKTQRNARIYSGLFPRKDGISRKDAETRRSAKVDFGIFPRRDAKRCTEVIEVTQRHARIDSLQVNWSLVEWSEWIIGFSPDSYWSVDPCPRTRMVSTTLDHRTDRQCGIGASSLVPHVPCPSFKQ